MSQKNIRNLVIFSAALIAVAIGIYFAYKFIAKETGKILTNYVSFEYKQEEANTKINCYGIKKNNKRKVIGTYTCAQNISCGFYNNGNRPWSSSEKPVALLYEDGEVFLYSFIENKRISDGYESFQNLYENSTTYETKHFVVSKSNKMGIIDTNGNVSVPLIYDQLANFKVSEIIDYSVKNDIITAKQNKKWGIIKITTGDMVMPIRFEEATIYEAKNIIYLKDNGKTFAYNLKGERILKLGYDYIQIFEKIAVVVNNRTLDIINLSGKKLNSTSLTTYMDYDKYACCGSPEGVLTYQNSKDLNKIMIKIDKLTNSSTWYESLYYSFDIETGNITFVEKRDA